MVDHWHPSHRHAIGVRSGSSAASFGTLWLMNALILATEALHIDPPGDDLATIAYAMLGAMALLTAIATWIATPKAKKH